MRMETTVQALLERLELSQYLDSFISAGFDSVASLDDISEGDLEQLGVRLGHRRTLQRDIFRRRGGSDRAGLNEPAEDISNTRPKRRYRRHPKPDANAPARPLSAYVAFANQFRTDSDNEGKGFVDLAKTTGEAWQNMFPDKRAKWEQEAQSRKDEYKQQVKEYRKTDEYVQYQRYLAEFQLAQRMVSPEGLRSKPKNTETASQSSARSRPKTPDQDSLLGNHHRRQSVYTDCSSSPNIKSPASTPKSIMKPYPTTSTQSCGTNDMLRRPQQSMPESASSSSDFALQFEVCLFLGQPTNLIPGFPGYGADFRAQSTHDFSHISRELFRSFDPNLLRSYLGSFLKNINHVLYFYRESDMRADLEQALSYSGDVYRSTTELCLVLAIGANFYKPQNLDASVLAYACGNMQIQNDGANEIWKVRTQALLCLYYADQDLNMSGHFITSAIQVGQYHNMDNADYAMSDYDDEDRDHWRRVWESVRVLYSWLLIRPDHQIGHLLDKNYTLDFFKPLPLSNECLQDRISQHNLSMIAFSLREVIRDAANTEKIPLTVLKAHLVCLDDLYAFTSSTTFAPSSPNSSVKLDINSSERERAAELHLRTLYASTICTLLHGELIQIVTSPSLTITPEMCLYANRCFNSAADIIKVCYAMFQAGYLTFAFSIPLHLLYRAGLTMLLGRPWIENHNDLCTITPATYNELVRVTDDMLADAAKISKACQKYLIIIRYLNRRMPADGQGHLSTSRDDGIAGFHNPGVGKGYDGSGGELLQDMIYTMDHDRVMETEYDDENEEL